MKIISQIKNIVLFHLEDPLKEIVEEALNGSQEAYAELHEHAKNSVNMSECDFQYLEYIIDLIDVYATDGDVEIENVILAPE